MISEWMGNGWALAGFTAISFVLTHLMSYLFCNETGRARLAYIALFLGGAALLTSFHSALSTVNLAKAELLTDRLERAGEDIASEVSSSEKFLCEFNPIRTDFSPSNFDQIEEQRLVACGIFKKINIYMKSSWDKSRMAFAPPDIDFKTVKDPIWKHSVDRLERATKEHLLILDQISATQPQPWLLWSALEPFIISISWCLGLAAIPPFRVRNKI
ncbi:hypothetical protein [Radicibacter daui]|uniref:hypothetical protein n=1 Tax=Radicibacter daui TaxID=3064829 RepID=UPI004046F3B5